MSDERDNLEDVNETPEVQDVNKLIKVRVDKLKELQKAGKDPFVHVKYDVDCHASDIHSDFAGYEGKSVTLGGRLMTKRNMGKASFIDVQDKSGRIQVYIRRDAVGDNIYDELEKLDIGDIVGVKGEVFKTQKGEISVKASECILLSKSLQPLPEKWHGLKDQELRYRQRYVDLIVNPGVKDVFIKRSAILRSIRNTLDNRGFMEVETPVLQPIAGGANARPFTTHHNALDMEMYLRIALELYLKRLIVGGLEKVYEIGRVFRNEGVSIKHNPEFTMLELYEAFTDYHGMMELCEDVISKASMAVNGTTKINYQGTDIDFTGPFRRMTMVDAVKEYAGIDFTDVKDLGEARKIAKEKGIEYEERDGVGNILSYLFEEFAEEHLIQPTFIIDHPWEISPLTKRKPGSEHLTERFELFVLGRELANAYSELNDPIDQRERFMHQESLREQGDDEANEMDEDFLLSVEYGMPPTGGIGIGIDRLVMFLTNSASIRDVLLFPTMRKI